MYSVNGKPQLYGLLNPRRTTIIKLASFGLLAAIQLVAADPRIGSWKLVSAVSAMTPPNKLSITPLKEEVHIVISGDTNVDFTGASNGHETPVKGNPAFDQVKLRRIDKHQSELTEKKDGVVVATILDRLSNDGQQLTLTTSQPGHPDKITVWTRAGGVKVAKDPFAGDWAEDLSKTRLAQALTLKIEADGSEGVRFSGEFSYTGHFDGKQYSLKNSVNDTVKLVLVDARTVDSFYYRDDKISQKDRWIVSADDQQMTMTTTGVLQSGQQISEKLQFQKQ